MTLFLVACLLAAPGQDRVPWDGSRMTGTPEPPPPYRTVPAFPNLKFQNPVELVYSPELKRYVLLEVNGKVLTFPDDPAVAGPDLCLDMKKTIDRFRRAYGLVFHPRFKENRYVYLCYVIDEKDPDGTRVSRFTMKPGDPPTIDVASEKILITWYSGGHNGGSLQFGPDGYLYISTGDGGPAFPPDPKNTGQDVSDLLSSILRIDVDRGDPYTIPADNPFQGTPGARAEVWAYGLRNPWRMSFDRETGELWVGDVGWEMWELVYRIERGGNYGWAVTEGSQPVKTGAGKGPTPILGPVIEHPHTEARSVTGGFVYRGTRLRELRGAYLYGDYITGKIWGLRHEDRNVTWQQELAESRLAIICFALDAAGELLVVDYFGGSITRLAANPAADRAVTFPTRLSKTGLFASAKDHAFAPGVLPYTLNAERFHDGATAGRFVALPGGTSLGVYRKRDGYKGYIRGEWSWPDGAVLGKTITLDGRRLETQILHRHEDLWRAYTYVWNDDQTDAELADAAGFDRLLTVDGGTRKKRWHFPGRAECVTCHNNRTGNIYGFTAPQLNRNGQLEAFDRLGFFKEGIPKKFSTMPSPHDANANLQGRARAFLHINCSNCHRRGAGGSAFFETTYTLALEKTKLIDAAPTQGDFGIRNAKVVAPGDPFRSVLYYRMSKLGSGHMPQLGSDGIDAAGIRLIHDWIKSLKPESKPAEVGRLDSDESIDGLLATPEGAMRLLRAMGDQSKTRREWIVARASSHPNIQVRDLFLRFVPEERRKKKLGAVINPSEILTLKGDSDRGAELFFRADTACIQCHVLGPKGREFGPDLSAIGKKYSAAQILEQIVEPSKSIHPDFLPYQIRTKEGEIFTGFIQKRTPKEIVLKEAADKTRSIPAGTVDVLKPSRLSVMPERLLRELTAQEAADLVAFLKSLR